MAQTKRKRRSKHRGTAAGNIEARGRTGRKLTADEQKKAERAAGREARLWRQPSWKNAALRAGLAAALLFAFTQLGLGPEVPLSQALLLCVLAMVIYVPLGYYFDRFIYTRRMRKRDGGGGGGGAGAAKR